MESSKVLHVAMFPWFAFGHFIPFLHLSNKLAGRGHRVSYLLPEGVEPNLQQLNQHPQFIRFFPIVVPHVDGLPPGAETASQVPVSLTDVLATAMDKTQHQVETILTNLKPDVVFFDFGCWIPSITRHIGTKSVYYSVVNAASLALLMVPARKMAQDMTLEERIQPPPGYPSSSVVVRRNEAPHTALINNLGLVMFLYERLTRSLKESDAIALRSCQEIEGPFCEYLAQQYSKPVLFTGPVLPETSASRLEDKWDKWLNKFEPGSVVFCALGSQTKLEKKQFEELVLGFELCGLPFLAALTPPQGCSNIEEALPEGFKERVVGRGWVSGEWMPQTLILQHSSVGCVSHCGHGSMWESLLSDSQMVLIPLILVDHFIGTRLMVEKLKVAVQVERGADGIIPKESLSKAIKSVMDKDSEVGNAVRINHFKWKKILSSKKWQDEYMDTFMQNLQDILNLGTTNSTSN